MDYVPMIHRSHEIQNDPSHDLLLHAAAGVVWKKHPEQRGEVEILVRRRRWSARLDLGVVVAMS
jgi:hypothetical protein